MPNHIHLILPKKSERRDGRKLAGIIGAFSSHLNQQNLWQLIPSPTSISDTHHLRRQLRYLALNPCRKSLCSDPLEWEWSTYRDVMGAVSCPWVSASRLSKFVGESERGFRVRFHSYVSGDPSVAVNGTLFPTAASPKKLAEAPIADIIAAASVSLRVQQTQLLRRHVARRVFVHLAHHQGWTRTSELATICGVSSRAIQLILLKASPELSAASLCLGDRRLRVRSSL
jgi:hypothetical protein